MSTKIFHFVSVQYKGSRWYAVRGHKPTIVKEPEPRCLFPKIRDAKNLYKFMVSESTFNNIKLDSIEVK